MANMANTMYNSAVETFREEEYPMMKGGKVYLDHAGATVYSRSLVEQYSAKLLCNLYGNPHSESDPAQLSGREVEEARREALAFFGADPEHFDLIFTANATAAIKLVGECFHDLAVTSGSEGFVYAYHRDAHTSLIGIRELTAQTHHHCFMNDKEVEDWIDGIGTSRVPYQAGQPGLFAYPGQSNMTGRRLPLQWTKELRQSNRLHHQNTYSLLDAAALATTYQLDFSDPEAAPDFTAVSFYKIFGLPDLGALIVRKDSGHILQWRRFFGGGTINMLTVNEPKPFVKRKDSSLHEALEDGTLPFHNIISLGCAIKVHKKLYGSMKNISKHTSFLAQRLYTGLASLRHENDRPVCVIYTDSEDNPYGDSTKQGATIAFSVVRQDGSYIGHSLVEKLANEKGIFIRSGGLCNAGGIAHYLQIETWQFKRAWSSGVRCGGSDDGTGIVNGKPTGVVRASLAAMSIMSDIDTFIDFMSATFATKGKLLHSHSGTSTATLNLAPKHVASMSNIRFEQQRSQLKSHQSEANLRTRITRQRGAKSILATQVPMQVQQALDEPYDQLVERRPVRSLESDHPQGELQKSSQTKSSRSKSSVQTHDVTDYKPPHEVEGKHSKLIRLKFWKKKPAAEPVFSVY